MVVQIRKAVKEDAYQVHRMIVELAEFEKCADQVRLTEDVLASQLMITPPPFECIISEDDMHGAIGFALFFYNYSTWTGKQGLHLEDLYVRPAFRNENIGRRMLQFLIERADKENLGRMDWMVLCWNERAQKFYSSLGARPVDDFAHWRLDKHSISELARPLSNLTFSRLNGARLGAI